MSLPHKRSAMTRVWAALSGIGLITTTLAVSGSATAAVPGDDVQQVEKSFIAGSYIVELNEEPAATYEGSTPGFERTRPEEGKRLNTDEASVQKYAGHLEAKQDEVLNAVGAKAKFKYKYTLNGFATNLTADQAAKLASDKRVKAVHRDVRQHLSTIKTPDSLGLDGPRGMWRQFGTPRKAGDGIVVGILDTGIDPTNPSFAGRKMPSAPTGKVNKPSMDADGNVTMKKSDGRTFKGKCETGEGWDSVNLCNDKMISARYFADPFLKLTPKDKRHPNEVISAMDHNGHGSHVAGTTAGNYGVPFIKGGKFQGRAAGMAPGAKIATYKVCFSDQDPNTGDCHGSASLAAIDQAVADGVDVINFSISGGRTNPLDPNEIAFKRAAAAGVFVAAAGGNAGPRPQTVSHNSPWLTTVAAATHTNYEGTVKFEDGRSFLGAATMDADFQLTTPTEMVYAGDIAAEGVEAKDAALCLADTLDPAKANGKVVFCDRGAIARVDKSKEAARAGAVGSILGNVEGGSDTVNADAHTVPTVHVNIETAKPIREAAKAGGVKVTLVEGNQSKTPSPAHPQVASFSSRGPNLMGDGNLLKPDLAAPGVDIIAAVPGHTWGAPFGKMSGTSMASPHAAGLSALVLSKYPHMSPMAVKSAMMTTAKDLLKADGAADKDNFATGAGHVDPTKFLKPGFILDSNVTDWDGYLKHVTGGKFETDAPAVRTQDLNLPSFKLSSLLTTDTVTRTATAVQPGTYTFSADMPGIDVKVSPAVLKFDKPGQKIDFTVTFTRTDAAVGQYTHGGLTWKNGDIAVRMPAAIRPLALKAPANVETAEGADSQEIEVVGGMKADVDLTFKGLAPFVVNSGAVKGSEDKEYKITVPEGAKLSRFQLIAGEGSKDLDMSIKNSDGVEVPSRGAGATGAASELVDIANLPAGEYTVTVNGYEVDGEGKYELQVATVTDEVSGIEAIEPQKLSIEPQKTNKVTLKFSERDKSKRYFGLLVFGDTGATTTVTVK